MRVFTTAPREYSLDYIETERALRRIDGAVEAAECHGLLCGMLCARGSVPFDTWIDEILLERESGDVVVKESRESMRELYDDTRRQLNSETLEFNMLLPEDDVSLRDRTHAVAAWCGGFVYGLGSAGLPASDKLPADTRELLEDFSEVSRATSGSGAAEELERAFVELVEFVRVGVLLINEELQPLRLQRQVH